MDGEKRVMTGKVDFIWEPDSGAGTLIAIEPDTGEDLHTFEIEQTLRSKLGDALVEGRHIEISHVTIEHEVVDPDTGRTSERLRPHVVAARMLD